MLLSIIVAAAIAARHPAPLIPQARIAVHVRYVKARRVSSPRAGGTRPNTTYAGTVTAWWQGGGGYNNIAYDSKISGLLATNYGKVYTITAPKNLQTYANMVGLDPNGIVYDQANNLIYVTVTQSYAIYVVHPGYAKLLAGGTQGTADGQGAAAQFESPTGVTVDSDDGDLYVADGLSVRRVTTSGAVTTVASIDPHNTCCGTQGIAFDSSDHNLYVADSYTNVIQQVDPTTGQTAWIAGRDLCCYQHDGVGIQAYLASPISIAYVSSTNSLYVADAYNNIIRQVTSSGVVTTLAGGGEDMRQSGVGVQAGFQDPLGVVSDPSGLLYVNDGGSIDNVTTAGTSPPPPPHGTAMTDIPIFPNGVSGAAMTADGSVWFSEAAPSVIGRILPSGSIRQYTLPFACVSPGFMTTGGDGNVWFSDTCGNGYQSYGAIARITAAGNVKEYALPHGSVFGGGAPAMILGPDGYVWFSDGDGSAASISTSGVVREYFLGGSWGITSGFDGNMWTTTLGTPNELNAIDRLTPAGALLDQYLIPNVFITSIASGPDNRIWFTNEDGYYPSVGALAVDGTVTMYQLTSGTNASNITLGPDGAMWFTEGGVQNLGTILRMTTDGSYSTMVVPSARSNPGAIVNAPDGTLWFADPGAQKMGHIH